MDMIKYGIPEGLAEISWDNKLGKINGDYEAIYKLAKKWVNDTIKKNGKNKYGLFFKGCNGSGKTALACLIVKTILDSGLNALRVTSIRMQAEFFEEWKIPPSVLINGVLVLDEVGKEYTTKQEHTESVLEYLLKYRTERLLPTILITNADFNYLATRYGRTVESVLKGRFIPINFPEVDLRILEMNKYLKKFQPEE